MVGGWPQEEEEKKEYLANLNSKRRLLSRDQPWLIKRCATNAVGTSFPCSPLTLE